MNITFADEQDDPLQPGPLVDLARRVLQGEQLPDDTEVAITLVDPERIAVLNTQHMGKSGPTDVLSFPLETLQPGVPTARGELGPPVALGDVVICPQVVRSRATAIGVDFEDEMALMVVHGLLHLLGYDHVEDEDAKQMEARESELLVRVGRIRP